MINNEYIQSLLSRKENISLEKINVLEEDGLYWWMFNKSAASYKLCTLINTPYVSILEAITMKSFVSLAVLTNIRKGANISSKV